jgi:predicted RNase H-like HicB family nuclease
VKYTVVLTKTGPDSYSIWSPDVPNCVATGSDPEALRSDFPGLLLTHFRLTGQARGKVPVPTAVVMTVDIDPEVA